MTPSALSLAAGVVEGATARSLPAVYQRITEIIDHPLSSSGDIAKVVSEDPALTARLLGLVNSAFFGSPNKIETVSVAISVIGTEQLRDLALATCVIHMFDDVPQQTLNMETFWLHSLAVATFARTLAVHRREGNVERFFLAGLLHDIGGLILLMQRSSNAKRNLKRSARTGELLHVVEKRAMGFDHADVGRALLKAWNLPLSLQDAVGSHHRPGAALGFPREAAVVHVADIISSALEIGSSGELLVPPLEPSAWELIGLPTNHISSLIDEGEAHISDVVRTMLWDQES